MIMLFKHSTSSGFMEMSLHAIAMSFGLTEMTCMQTSLD
jgi:hypothetical protein